jgi:hypothetical protein
MSRTDLTEDQLRELKRWMRHLCDGGLKVEPHRVADYVERLTGEVLELRNREANVRQIQGLEWDEY